MGLSKCPCPSSLIMVHLQFVSIMILASWSNAASVSSIPRLLNAPASKLVIHSPDGLVKDEGYDHRDGLFGTVPYGGSIRQKLIYADSDLCDPNVDTRKGYPERSVDPDTGEMDPWPAPFLLMVDRGGCTFVKKVRNAQRVGAAAVIIADTTCLCSDDGCTAADPTTTCEISEPIMADDGSGADIVIPSVLIFKLDGDAIKESLRNNINVDLELEWTLPQGGDHVQYDLFSIPGDPLLKDFFRLFRDIAANLGPNASFTPHPYIYDGVRTNCVGANGENYCYNMCTNNGRYCATDPENDLDNGTSGADVVKESLRRMCIWQVYGTDGVGTAYFDYVTEFEIQCNAKGLFTDQDCILETYVEFGINPTKIEACMTDSGGLDGNNQNSLLDSAVSVQNEKGVVVIPTMFVNNAAVRGQLSAENVFSAICAGYGSGIEAPDLCDLCIGRLPTCFGTDIVQCAVTFGGCEALAAGAGSGQTGGDDNSLELGDSTTNDEPLSSSQVADLIMGIAGSLDGLEVCGLNFEELASTAIDAVSQPNLGETLDFSESTSFHFNDKCTEQEASEFDSVLTKFHSCAGWDFGELVETLPSALVGAGMRCADSILKMDASGESLDDVLVDCVEVILGDDPFSIAIKSILLKPDKNCACFEQLAQSVPECQLGVWPIPIMGSWTKKIACLMSELGCGLFAMWCVAELSALDACLPKDLEIDSCVDITGGCADADKSVLLSAPPRISGMPLPDACVRVYKDQNESTFAGDNLLERYELFANKCGAGSSLWDLEGSLSSKVSGTSAGVGAGGLSSRNQDDTGETAAQEPNEMPSSKAWNLASGFLVGVVVGCSVSMIAVYHRQAKGTLNAQVASKGKYAAIEMT